jgi:hypothetical protein
MSEELLLSNIDGQVVFNHLYVELRDFPKKVTGQESGNLE